MTGSKSLTDHQPAQDFREDDECKHSYSCSPFMLKDERKTLDKARGKWYFVYANVKSAKLLTRLTDLR